MVRHLRHGSRPVNGFGGHFTEVRPDAFEQAVRIDIAHRYHRHHFGLIPFAVEVANTLRLERVQDLLLADRQSVGIPGATEENRQVLVAQALAGAASEPPFLDDHPAFLLNLFVLVLYAERPVAQDSEPLVDRAFLVGWYLQDVDGLVETRVGVQSRTEPHADRLHVVDQFLLVEVLCAVEGHMLQEMCQSLLIVLFQHRTRFHHEAQLQAVFRFRVLPHVVGKTVLQLTRPRTRVEAQRPVFLITSTQEAEHQAQQ